MFLMIDNYDSFTYNLVQDFSTLGEKVEVYTNNTSISKIDFSRYVGIILSPGPSGPENAGLTLEVIKKYSSTIPMLGVCLGMQSLAHVFGGTILKAERIMHGKVDTVYHLGGDLFRNVPRRFPAVRYHSLAVSADSLPDCFEICAYASDGEIMAIRHRSLYIWGVQFHPESYLTEAGKNIIKNFIGGAYEYHRKHSCSV